MFSGTPYRSPSVKAAPMLVVILATRQCRRQGGATADISQKYGNGLTTDNVGTPDTWADISVDQNNVKITTYYIGRQVGPADNFDNVGGVSATLTNGPTLSADEITSKRRATCRPRMTVCVCCGPNTYFA